MTRRLIGHWLAVLCILGSAPVRMASAELPGSVVGAVLDDNQRPLASATVVFSRITKLGRDPAGRALQLEPPFSKTVRSGADGKFQAAGLPPGSYHVCAYGTRFEHLSSCQWRSADPQVSVTAGSVISGLVREIRTGSIVKVRIADPGRKIRIRDPRGARASQTNVAVGVMSEKGEYAGARLVGQDAGGSDYAVAVPRNATLRLFVEAEIDIFDSAGQAVRQGVPSLAIDVGSRPEVQVNLLAR